MASRYFAVILTAAISALMTTVACLDCDRSGCAALEHEAEISVVTQGLAGAGVFQSDVFVKLFGQVCNECPFEDVRLSIWKASSPVDSVEAAAALCQSGEPFAAVHGEPWYEISLTVGDYIACERDSYSVETDNICIAFAVAEGKVTTLYAIHPYGISWFVVSKPGERPGEAVPLYVRCSPEVVPVDSDVLDAVTD